MNQKISMSTIHTSNMNERSSVVVVVSLLSVSTFAVDSRFNRISQIFVGNNCLKIY